MELRQLRYFLAVAEERHFGRAAQRLRIAQPGLSQQIRALERSLGVRLFDRGARPIELTTEGAVLREQARLLIELADGMVEQARLGDGVKTAVLKLGGGAIGNGPVADEVLRTFRARFSDIDVQLHPGTTRQNILALNRGTLDAVFAYVPFESAEAPRYLRLGDVELVLALPEGHPLAAMEWVPRKELLKEPFLVWPRAVNPPMVDHVHRSLFGRIDHPHPVELQDIGTSRWRLVAEGAGIGPIVFPAEALLPIPGVVYRRVEDPAPLVEYGLMWFDNHASPELSAFVEHARTIAESTAASPDGRLAIQGV